MPRSFGSASVKPLEVMPTTFKWRMKNEEWRTQDTEAGGRRSILILHSAFLILHLIVARPRLAVRVGDERRHVQLVFASIDHRQGAVRGLERKVADALHHIVQAHTRRDV